MIIIRGLNKAFGEKIIFSNFNLEIPDGSFVVISGDSGSGKSTLLNMIGGIEKPDSGSIIIEGLNITRLKNKNSFFADTVGFLFQNFALLENKTVKENLSLIKKSSRTKVSLKEALNRVGLSKEVNKKVYQLSGGEQQRVALARLMMKKCSVVLADEPTGSLDKKNRDKLKRTCAIVLAVVLTVTFIGHQFATSIWGPYSIMEGTTFEDYDSFIEYMEQDVPANPSYNASLKESAAVPAPEEQIGTPTYYDEYGNEISEEEALKSRLKDKNGNVVCEYISRRSVVSLRYTPKDGTILPITVCTEEDLQEARQVAAVRHVIFGAAYCIECLAVVLVYFKKRAK